MVTDSSVAEAAVGRSRHYSPLFRGRRVAIIGAGASGMLAAIELEKAGFHNVSIYEKRDEVGGTWRDNRYPGLHCDVPSRSYCFSFALNPGWSQQFASGPEIQRYMKRVADDFGLRRRIRFNSEVVKAHFDGSAWQLSMADGHRAEADFVFAATGVLHHLNLPDIAGIADFAGRIVHTGDWPAGLDLSGQRVGIIGTGATAAQLVPAIVDEVKELTLFQRTAQWIAPSPNKPVSWWEKLRYRLFPAQLAHEYRRLTDEIEATAGRWVLKDSEVYPRLVRTCQKNLATVQDPELRQKLTPDYEPGCKRQIYSSTFYPAIQKANAHLCVERIERIEPKGIRTVDGQLHEIDLLVLATGYRMHDYMRPMHISVAGRQTLDEIWADGEIAHRGVSVPGVPNFFMLVGPNSPLTNYSVIAVAEMQMAYLMDLLLLADEQGARTIEASREAANRFAEQLGTAMPGTVWASGCASYYLDRNGRPNTWPWSIAKFREDMGAVLPDEYLLTR